MIIATVTLSSKGQVAIPKRIRNEIHWDAGTELTLLSSETGVSIKAAPKRSGRSLTDLIGMLAHEGPPLSTEDLCRSVDYREDRKDSTRRDP